MKEEFWQELLKIFKDNIDLQSKHEKLFKNISLIVETTNLHKELEKLNNELTELNK